MPSDYKKPIKTIVSWSSGKDSTLTLIRLMADPNYDVIGLFTTYVDDEVPFQATPLAVVRAQAKLTNLPLIEIALPEVFPDNAVYQNTIIGGLKDSDLLFDAIAFGDLFCNGIMEYRRGFLEPAGWQCLFPLMGQDTATLAQEIIDIGIRTMLVTVDTTQLDGKFCGRWYDLTLLNELPPSCDLCGEDGEFHTLVMSAPCFNGELTVSLEHIERNERFHHQRYHLTT
ncbi:hypothetical protein [Vibrio rumoiensis]|uniref:ATPase n=1 Tax=Vibrio rumoiensis 1S-45 TaxID=1188252 RepID=A0A1E5E396_9VIBR|nr:hypothetical protein [Vibrio rumoiensis]OEF26264.1 ATPase [Vibrio rumoiensis 1S-45]